MTARVLLRIIVALGWLTIIPLFLIMPLGIAHGTKTILYFLCGVAGVLNLYTVAPYIRAKLRKEKR